jgi:anti-sigma regulatory factor (Ser/Thr protein kinase)
MCRDATETYGCDVWSPNRARRFCTDHIASALLSGVQRDAVTDDAAIIASELVTNSVNAGCGQVHITLTIHHDYLRLAVRDDADGLPQRRTAGPEDAHGRGLAITAVLARSWGVDPTEPGKQVWAELAVPPALTHGLDCRI